MYVIWSLIMLLELGIGAVSIRAMQYNVGDKAGWKVPVDNRVNYTAWALQHIYHVEDALHFKYEKGADNVLQVNEASYASCSNASPIANYDDGDSVVYLLREGWYWFMSGVEKHCNSGQKFFIQVLPYQHMRAFAPSTEAPASPSEDPLPRIRQAISPSSSHLHRYCIPTFQILLAIMCLIAFIG